MTNHSDTRHWLGITALAALLGLAWRNVQQVHRQRLHKRPHAEPEHIQTWEGEGGGVPVATNRTAAQVRPTPAPVAFPREVER
jgi:hypothetical protein